MTRVTVIIRTYNRTDLLSECLKSVLAQFFRDSKIIVIDDGSTDAPSIPALGRAARRSRGCLLGQAKCRSIAQKGGWDYAESRGHTGKH